MENRRQNTTERRLAQVRALKERYFADELTVEERLEAKDARIALLESQVAELQRRLDQLERLQSDRDVTSSSPRRPQPEVSAPSNAEQTGFDFYRD